MNSMCRGCMTTNVTDLHSIFNDNLPELYFTLTSLDISTDDGLPAAICTMCKTNLQTFNAFKLKCIESHSKCMQQLEIVKVKIEETDVPYNENQIKDDVLKLIDESGFENDWQNSDSDDLKSSKLYVSKIGFFFISLIFFLYFREINNERAENIVHNDKIGRRKREEKSEKTNKKATTKSAKKDQQKHPCPSCDKSFMHLSILAKHIKTHTDPTVYECDICKKRYRLLSKLRLHIRMRHTTEHRCACEICGKILGNSSTLKYHMKTHSEERPFECSTCGKRFARDVYLKNHERFHGSRNHLCSVCSKAFYTINGLYKHLAIHSGIRQHACPICNHSFTDSTNLRQHMVVHSNSRPFACEVCQKTFRDQIALRRHRKTHLGEKPFVCPICSKCLTRLTHLKAHIARHR